MKSARFLVRGFTLIELLVVIAVLAVIAAGVVVGINPAKRINQANDTKIQNDIGQTATALEAYYTSNQAYPASIQALVDSGDLKIKPDPPGAGTDYSYDPSSVGCAPAGTVCKAAVYYTLNDQNPSVPNDEVWCWRSSTGGATKVGVGGCTNP